MRTLHPRVNSRFDNRIEQAGNGLNSIFNLLLWCATIAFLIMQYNPPKMHHKSDPERIERVGSISEMDYLIAVSSAKQKAAPLSQAQLDEMDRQASLQTRPEDVAKLKPKAKATYYATLKRSIWDAVE